MTIQPADAAPLSLLLSAERLSALSSLTGSMERAIELHQETLQVGAGLMTVIATIEIGLRNAVSENLGHFFAVPNWLQQPPVGFIWRTMEANKIKMAIDSAKRDEYSKLNQAAKGALDAVSYPNGRPAGISHQKRAKDRRKHITVTEGKVIAELTLYFWKRLYGDDYNHHLWKPTLRRTFPDKKLQRPIVATQLEHLYQARNRLAHHEPVLRQRFVDTMSAVDFVSQRLGMNNPNVTSPLANLIADDVAAVKAKAAALHTKLDSYRVP